MDYAPMIREQAKKFKLSPILVSAVCQVESAMNPNAVRFEPKWVYWFQPEVVRPPGTSLATEKAFQMCSWGLMQVMGAVYREYGYRGPLHCVRIEDQLFYGCKHLRRKIERYGMKEGVQAYNTGSPLNNGDYRYYHKVMAALSPVPHQPQRTAVQSLETPPSISPLVDLTRLG